MQILFYFLAACWAAWCFAWGLESGRESGGTFPVGIFVFWISVVFGAAGLGIFGTFVFHSWYPLLVGLGVAIVSALYCRFADVLH